MKAKPLVLSLCLVAPSLFTPVFAEETAPLEAEFLDFLSLTAPEMLSCQKQSTVDQSEESPAP